MHIQIFLGEHENVSYFLSPTEIQNKLMRNPEILNNIDKFLAYLIKYNENSSNNSPSILLNSISINNLQEKLFNTNTYVKIELNPF